MALKLVQYTRAPFRVTKKLKLVKAGSTGTPPPTSGQGWPRGNKQ